MKKSVFKILLIAPALVVSSCGYGLKEVYSGIPYNTTDFFKNYYNVWNDNINPYKDGNKITVSKDEESSIFAFSAASLILCKLPLSVISTPHSILIWALI